MAKAKKKFNPDRLKVKPSREVTKNPFEVKLNKQKHQVINRKFKSERGLPGVARDRAISKRKATLLGEYTRRHKDNLLVDKRIGEGDAGMDPEERMAMRLARESNRKLNKKKNIFNLNDDEVLTHMGQSLDDVDPGNDDPRSDDDDIYDKLDAAFVKEAHFGGFMTKSRGSEENRKRAIDDLIAESKRAKMERQMEVDQNIQLTEQLDSKWKDLHTLLATGKPKKDTQSGDANQPDSFDLLVSELQYAPRAGVAMDKTKTQEEIDQDERDRLEELEKERRVRAMGNDSQAAKKHKIKHVSADDINDGFAVSENEEEDENQPENDESGSEDSANEEEDNSNGEKSDDDEEHVGDDDVDSANGSADESEADSFDDLELNSEEEEEEEEQVNRPKKEISKAPKSILKKIEIKNLTTDIPYLIAVPDSMDSYAVLIDNRKIEEELLIVDRIIKGNAPSLHEQNRKRLEHFLQLLIDRIFILLDEPSVTPETLRRVDGLIPSIHHLVELSPVVAARSFQEVIKNIYFGEKTNGPKKESNFPGFEKLIMLKLVGICFSVSDLKHLVGSPALICMAHMLTTCKINDGRNMVRGIFMAQLMLEYVSFAEKYCPEVIAFILRVLAESHRLTVTGQVREKDLRLSFSDLYKSYDHEIPRTDRCKIVFALLNLIKLASEVFDKLPSFCEIFGKIQQKIEKLESSWYPEPLKELLGQLNEKLSQRRARPVLCREKRRPQMLRLYEPLIEERVDMLRKIHQDKGAKGEMKKLQSKYKKEMKSTMREIRRDNQFIAQHKLKEQIKKDADRRMKVKKLFGDLTSQQGEMNSLDKLKAKQKKKNRQACRINF